MKKLLVGLFVFSFLVVGLKVSIAEAVDSQVTLFLGNTQSVVFNGQNLELELKTLDGSTGIYGLEVNGILKSASSFGAELSITDSASLKGISYSAINSVTQSVTLQLLEKITPSIAVLSPNGGEVYKEGQSINISLSGGLNGARVGLVYPDFNSNNQISDGNDVHWLSISSDAGKSFIWDGLSFIDNNGNKNYWTAGTGNYKIVAIRDVDDSKCYQNKISDCVFDMSDNSFNITSVSAAPSITVLTPNGRDMYEVGQQINVTWDSTGIPENSNNINITLHGYNANGVITWSKELSSFTLNDGQEKVILPTYLGGVPFGKNFKIAAGTDSTNNSSSVSDFSDTTFTIGKATEVTNGGCSNGEVYSSTSGQKCPGITVPSIKVLSPNGGEVYKEGDIVRVKWTSNNLPADYRINLVFNYLDELKDEYKQSVLITKVQDKGYYDYKLPMFSQYKKTNYPLPGKNYEFTAYLFDSSLFNAPSSNAVAIGSSAHGSNDGFFTINILNTFTPDTSCSAGAVYSFMTGKKCFEKDEVKDTGCIAGYNYSSTTGKPCALGLYKNDNTDVLNPITSSIKRTLKLGIKGDDVKALQAFLNLLADGSFGPKTQAKVIEWQATHGLTADGAFGPMSRQKAGLNQ